MPMTVNGIGTHYYGKRNRASRVGVCRACGAQNRLESYDTRLWFVIFFIPVIPFGRKRIMDQCSCCRRHWVASHSAFEMSKQLNVSGALEKYREQPSAETALELHGCLLAYHQHEQAEQFRKQALELHPDDATLCAGLAVQLQQAGQWDSAAPLFEQALQLRPDLPAARVGVAGLRILNNEVDQARELLRFLELPGAGQLYSLEPLERLAHAYQRLGRHSETLELCGQLLTELPAVGQNYGFRKFVATSEKALGRRESILPKRVFSIRSLFDAKRGPYASWQRWLAVGAVAAVLVLVGAAISNEYWRRHRTVFAASDYGKPIQVIVDDGPPVQIGALTRLQLAEGRHHVKVAAPVNEEFDIAMGTGYFERWSKHPVWVLNVDGGLALMADTMHYSANPKPAPGRLLIGERFYYFADMDYPFEDPPEFIHAEKNSAEVIKTHLGRMNHPVGDVFRYAMRNCDATSALNYAEAWLRLNRENTALLDEYTEAAENAGQVPRARRFLQAGLPTQPLSIPWHRAYQDVTFLTGQDAETAMIADYDALLTKEPNNAALLYLRGKVEGDHAKEKDFYQRTCAADATLGWSWGDLARLAATVGDWKQARTLADKACAAKLDTAAARMLRRETRLATGDMAALEAEYRRDLGPTAEKAETLINLCELLAIQGKADEARQTLADWERRLPPPIRASDTILVYRACVLYMLGDFVALQQLDLNRLSLISPEAQFHVLAALGRPQDMLQNEGLKKPHRAAWNALVISLAFALSGDVAEAAAWREKACAAFSRRGPSARRVAALLSSDKPPSQRQLDDVAANPPWKAILIATLALRFPKEKESLAKQIQVLNVSRRPPCQLLRKVVGDAR